MWVLFVGAFMLGAVVGAIVMAMACMSDDEDDRV